MSDTLPRTERMTPLIELVGRVRDVGGERDLAGGHQAIVLVDLLAGARDFDRARRAEALHAGIAHMDGLEAENLAGVGVGEGLAGAEDLPVDGVPGDAGPRRRRCCRRR